MRFVIQAVQTAPQLRSFVCEMLSTLVNKAVWTNSSQWKGWVRCVQDLVPDSLPVLLQVQICCTPSYNDAMMPASSISMIHCCHPSRMSLLSCSAIIAPFAGTDYAL